VRPMDSLALRHDGRTLRILDQTLLPDQELWLEAADPAVMIEHIKRLAVRGAPLIGVAAALSLACMAEAGAAPAALKQAAAALAKGCRIHSARVSNSSCWTSACVL